MTIFNWVGAFSNDGEEYLETEGFTATNVGASGYDVQLNVLTEGSGFNYVRTDDDTVVYDDGGTVPNTLGGTNLRLGGVGNGNGDDTASVEITFNDTGTSDGADVDGAEFYITDLDTDGWDDQVTIFAYDAAGNALRVYLTPGVAGNQLVTAVNNSNDPADGYSIDAVVANTDNSDLSGAVLVQITGPVSRIVIDYGNLGAGGQQITISGIEFDNAAIPCLTLGTLIETPSGMVTIENLNVGDVVVTKDNGNQTLRWIGSKKVLGTGKMAPIHFSAGAIGNDRDLKVSPNHRMLVEGWRAELLFGTSEVLVAAKYLTNGDTIFQMDQAETEYFHILFDDHQVIYAEGVPTESFHPGSVSLGVLDEDAKQEILELFPELAEDPNNYGQSAVASLKNYEARLLAS